MILRPMHNRYDRTRLSAPMFSLAGCASAGKLPDEYVGKFSRGHFLSPGVPLLMGSVILPRDVPRVLRVPIKRPGSAYRIPGELWPLRTVLDHAICAEHASNHAANKMHAHVTFDRQFVIAGETHRMPGFHVDGFQGSHKAPKPVEHSYIAVSGEPTQFSDSGYDIRHLPSWAHAFAILGSLVRPSDVFDIEEMRLYRMSCYQVHRTPPVRRTGWRSFVRVTFAHEELEDNRNTVNPHFDGQSYRERSDIRDSLVVTEWPNER